MRESDSNRVKSYQQLVIRRRSCHACTDLVNPCDVDGGAYDTGEIGPWSAWQGRLDADVMVVGQDYSDVAYFKRRAGIEDPANPTNLNLVKLLASIGVTISPPGTRDGRGQAFFTNAILCLKAGGMQAPVRPAWFAACGGRFLRSQIELVNPRVVVGLGERANNAVRAAYGLASIRLREAITSAGDQLPSGPTLIAVYHCGARVINSVRSFNDQLQDWQRVAAVLAAPAA